MNKKTPVAADAPAISAAALCPACGLQHPQSFSQCVSCGTALSPASSAQIESLFNNPVQKATAKDDPIEQLEKAFRSDGLGQSGGKANSLSAALKEQEAAAKERLAAKRIQEAERRQHEALLLEQQAKQKELAAAQMEARAAQKLQELEQFMRQADRRLREAQLQEKTARIEFDSQPAPQQTYVRDHGALLSEQEVPRSAPQEGLRRAEMAFIEMETKRRAAEQARAEEQAKAVEEALAAAQARADEQARAVAQARADEQARRAEAQAKAEEEARAAAAQATADQQARLAAAQAKDEEQARAAAQARADEQARAAAQARADEQARAAAQARADEQARAAAQARADEQAAAMARNDVSLLADSNALLAGTRDSGTRFVVDDHYDEIEDDLLDANDDETFEDGADERLSIWHRLRQISIPHAGKVFFAVVVMISAGATFFFLTKASDDQDLVEQGLTQLSKGQYAFSVESLTKAASKRPHDARVFLSLARAYIGVDQVDEAWKCISQAQQLGSSVASDPALAMELANYYQKRDNREKAVELLRPLAQANVPGTRTDLADIDASWGDELLRDGKLEEALRCWEEVSELKSGSRASEAPARLTTIYQKLATSLASDNNTNNDADALKYLNKLNSISETPKNLEMAADLQQKSGQLDDAIASLRKAASLDSKNRAVAAKLAKLLKRRGQEMLDQGNVEGNQYLEEASGLSAARNTNSEQPAKQPAVTETQETQTPQPEIKEKTTKALSKTNAPAGGGYRVMTPPEQSTPARSVEQAKSADSSSSSEKPLEMRLIDEDPSVASPQEKQ